MKPAHPLFVDDSGSITSAQKIQIRTDALKMALQLSPESSMFESALKIEKFLKEALLSEESQPDDLDPEEVARMTKSLFKTMKVQND